MDDNKVVTVASMEALEKQAITNALIAFKGNLSEAAKALGIGRATLFRKVKEHNIDVKQARLQGNHQEDQKP